MTKPTLPIIFRINAESDEIRVDYFGNVAPNFPSLAQVILKWRSQIKLLFSKSVVTVPYIYYFYPEVRAAKRMLRKHFRDEERKIVLTLFNDIAVTQVVYSNPVIQDFFQFALMYAWQNSQINKKTFSIKKAKSAFELAFQNSLNNSAHKEQSRSQKAAIAVFDFAFQLSFRWSFEPKTLQMIGKGKKEGDLRKKTKRIHALADRGYKDREIAVILHHNLDPQKKAEVEKIVAEIRREDVQIDDIAKTIPQIRYRRKKNKKEFTKQNAKK
ncbi:MAG TPA: hypothetical protein VF644_02880 [Pyrinomonadaceae bacterium]|jgi:hypothetical protein